MGFREKVRIATLEQENTHAPFFIHEWNNMTGAHSGVCEILVKLGASLFTVGVDLFSALRHQQRLVQNRGPLQDFAQTAVLRIIRIQLRGARNGFELNPATLIKSNAGALV